MRIVYLHGFISSPDSTKARLFARRLEGAGGLAVPDLNEPDFSDLTISRVIRKVEGLLPEGGTGALIGSSMGGWAAALFATLHPDRVRRLVLMAPALNMADLLEGRLGPEGVEAWRRDGVVPIEHAAYGSVQRLRYEFLEDARRWSTLQVRLSCPTLILHGRHDEDVPISVSERLAAAEENVELIRYDAGHRLDEVVEDVLERALEFLAAREQGSGDPAGI